MEAEWTLGLQRLLDVSSEDLPVLWDADFLRGANGGEDSHVLCEINVSCVVPLAPSAPAALAAEALRCVRRRR